MENRFRKFISNRRTRSTEAGNAPDLTKSSLPYHATSPSTQPPIFLYQRRSRNGKQAQEGHGKLAAPMRSFSYDSVSAGKTPVLGARPQRGNGPVKLQANRRLSSGELIATTQDAQRTLQDIREGDYVVGKKGRPMSPDRGRPEMQPLQAQFSSNSQISHSYVATPASRTPVASQTWPNTPTSSRDSLPARNHESINETGTTFGLGLSPPSFVHQSRLSHDSHSDYRFHRSQTSIANESTKSRYTSVAEANATLQALRKAEYSRLVETYGHDAAERSLSRMNQKQPRSPSTSHLPIPQPQSPVILEPLPAPHLENPISQSNRSSHMSGTSDSCCDEWSLTSSPQRVSYVSSYAGSSNATAQTSIVEDDPDFTRDSIHSVVEQMRATYLNAYDERQASSPKTKIRKKKTRPKAKLMPSPALCGVDEISSSPASVGRQTWHPQCQNGDQQFRRRIHSHPVSNVGRLSPIQASPSRDADTRLGLQRADSTTLGSIMADVTRASLKSRISPRPKKTSTTQSDTYDTIDLDFRPAVSQHHAGAKKESWLNLEPDSAEEYVVDSPQDASKTLSDPSGIVHQAANDTCSSRHSTSSRSADTFDSLYQDLFGKDVDDVWSSSSSFSSKNPSLNLIYSSENAANSTYRPSTPRKRSCIASIPESPEYTRLADPNKPEDNFI